MCDARQIISENLTLAEARVGRPGFGGRVEARENDGLEKVSKCKTNDKKIV